MGSTADVGLQNTDDAQEDPSAVAGTIPAEFQLAVFDLAGTTLDDKVDGQPVAISAICEAFAKVDMSIDPSFVTKYRGLEKREAIRKIINEMTVLSQGGDDNATLRRSKDQDEFVEEVHAHFKDALDHLLSTSTFNEIPGTSAAFSALRQRGVKIVIASGFAINIVQALVGRLGWDVDAIVFAQRPRPDAIQKAMGMFSVSDRRTVLKVGDTVADVEEGRAAGVFTVAVLTGTQPRASLVAAGPDMVLGSIAEIPDVLFPVVEKDEASGSATL